MSVLVLGSANMDLVVTAARAPAAGETLTGTSFRTGLGGKGLNQAVAAARCGATVAFLGCVGVDAHGDALLSGLAAEGVDVRALRRDDRRASGAALIVVTADAENRIIVVPGANAAVGVDDITELRARLDATCVLALALEIPLATVVDAVAAARESAARVVLDPAPVPRAGLPSSVYAEHVVLTPNETEAALLVGHAVRDRAGAERAARTLLDRGAGAVVLKLGERGAFWATASAVGWRTAPQVAVVDTVAAGDALNGALAAALAEGMPLAEAVRWGVTAGAVAVTREGAHEAMPLRSEIVAALSE